MVAPGELELVVDGHAELGEGPHWWPAREVLIWVDILVGRVHLFDPRTKADDVIEVGQPVGAACPTVSGRLVVALRDGLGLAGIEGAPVEMIATVEGERPGNRMNDGKCDPAGRLWAGTMALDGSSGAGALYRLEGATVRRVLRGVTISNGLGWSRARDLMYYIDSPTQGVDVFDYDAASGAIENRRRLVEIPEEQGLPDGLTVDAEGFLWIACYGGGTVRRFAPDGAPDAVVSLPVTQVTSCAFGGPGLANLYITSAAQGLSGAELGKQPHAGGIFATRPVAPGLAPNLFDDRPASAG